MPPFAASSPPLRLLAVDLDGTLVRTDGSIAPSDHAALARARREGVIVTLATGRLAPAAVAIARSFDLDAPLVCADGAALVCPRSGETLARWPVADAAAVLAAMAAHELAALAFFADAIVGDARAAVLAELVRPWSPRLSFGSPLAIGAGAVLMALGLGEGRRVEAALAAVEEVSGAGAAVSGFSMGAGDTWALRVQARGVSKAEALSLVAARYGVSRDGVGAIGDWYNDVSMLRWAGRSCAMSGAPAEVRAAAREEGGSVAEAVARWMEG
jgi:hypothetical protein